MMKIKESTVHKLVISRVVGLDPVSVYIEEFGHGEAKVIIDCYGDSWSSYWGAMGGDLKEFFTRTSVSYLVNCFDRGIRETTGELDTHAMQKTFVTEVRRCVIERVRDSYTRCPANRDVYDECVNVDLSSITPEHPYDTWSMDHYTMTEDSWKEIFLDEDYFTEWMCDNVPEKYEDNHRYTYLSNIVSVVKEAVTGIKEKNDG